MYMCTALQQNVTLFIRPRPDDSFHMVFPSAGAGRSLAVHHCIVYTLCGNLKGADTGQRAAPSPEWLDR